MNVTLRKKSGMKKISLYLDIYHNGIRKYQYLKLYLHKDPSTPIEKTHNKETLKLAKSIEAKQQLDLQSKLFGFQNLDLANTSFTEYFLNLAEARKGSEGNHGNWTASINHFNAFAKRDIKFSEITTRYIRQYKSYLENDSSNKKGNSISPNSASSYFNKFRAALKQAVVDEIIEENPAKNIEGIKELVTQIEYLSEEEVIKLKDTHCDIPVMKDAFLFACYTGLRFSDMHKLTWSEIQESNGQFKIRFRQKKTNMPESHPIPNESIKLLGDRAGLNELVFTDLHYSDNNNTKLREWMVRTGIPRHITFHSSRHTYATLLLTKGEDIYTVSKLLGHKSVKTTERYAKVIDLKKEVAVNKLNF